MRKHLLFALMIITVAAFTGCGKTADVQNNGNNSGVDLVDGGQAATEEIDDWMDVSAEENCQFYVMNLKDNYVEVYNEGEVHTRPLMLDNGVELPKIEDGHFKKLTADVNIYNGGEEGYSGDKFIKKISKAEYADYQEVFEALEIRDASGNGFSARELLKYQDLNDNYLIVADGHEAEVYKDGESFTKFSLDNVIGTDYPEPFFEALEASKEAQLVQEGSAGDAYSETTDISTGSDASENGKGSGTYEYVEVDGYKQITVATAQKIMAEETGYLIVDVRTDTEYYDKHIPGAVLIPNEYIEDQPIPELPDKDQMLLVYCRSGRRSKDAARKLAEIGYTNVYEFGGIIYWPGPISLED